MFGGSCYRWTVWYCVSIVLISCKRPDNTNDTAGIIDGDLILGGLFRIRKINGSNKCNKEVEAQVGIQRVEAMLYAIHEINENQTLLPNVTLGAEIRDTCSLKTKALDESLKFILDSVTLNSRSQQSEKCLRNRTKDLVGVVGPSRSTLSIEVAKLLRLFKVPQVSYASTSPELSNKNKYSYFSRTVPSDSLQAQAMIHVLRKFNWSSVFTVNSAGSYGENGIAEFKRLAKSKNSSVCVVLSEQVTDESTITDYKEVIEKFKKHPSTRAIVLFLKDNHVKNLLRAAKESKYTKKVWIASDEWGIRADIVQNLDNFFDQSDGITLTLSSFREKKFETYFCDLCASKARRENPWFQQYWRQYNRICYSNNQTCNITYNNKIPYVIEAVYAFANALHAMYKSKCPQMNGLCSAMRPVNKTELRDLILQGNGDSKGRYDVYHYANHGSYIKLGEWQKELNLTSVPSRLNSITSTCNDTCNPWSRKVLKKETTCCFECFDCPNKERQYVVNESKCEDCDITQRPRADYRGCENLPSRHISREWFITITFFACLGALCTLIVTGLFVYNINTPLVKASERDMIFLLLLGVFLNYMATIFFVVEPNVVICAVQRFSSGFAATICYATLLVKIDRIGKIFTARNVKSVHFTKQHTQLVIVFLLIAIEVSLAAVGLVINPPNVINVSPTKNDIFAKCNYGKLEYMTSLPYNLLLIVLCTFYSFRIRKTTSMFNEAKYIGLVMYSTCVVWTAFLPVHLGTSERYEPITIGLNFTLDATTILVCLFGPKVYIIVFRSMRNVERSASVTVNNNVIHQQSKGQPSHVKTNSTDIPKLPSSSSKQTSKGEKREQVNLEILALKNIVNGNISEDVNAETKHEQRSEIDNSQAQSQDDSKL